MTDTETAVQTYPATLLQTVLAEMAWERLNLPQILRGAPIDTRQLLVEHISYMLAILASDAAYTELWERVRSESNEG